MTITIILISTIVVLTAALVWVSVNSMKKQESLEEQLASQAEDVKYYQLKALALLDTFQQIDNQQIFESDDDVGKAFNILKATADYTYANIQENGG